MPSVKMKRYIVFAMRRAGMTMTRNQYFRKLSFDTAGQLYLLCNPASIAIETSWRDTSTPKFIRSRNYVGLLAATPGRSR